ncbi:MAG: hypothetical protein ABWZ17_06400 [Candidatus Binatia bacterium]
MTTQYSCFLCGRDIEERDIKEDPELFVWGQDEDCFMPICEGCVEEGRDLTRAQTDEADLIMLADWIEAKERERELEEKLEVLEAEKRSKARHPSNRFRMRDS